MSRLYATIICIGLTLIGTSVGAESKARPIDLLDIGAPSFTTFTARDGVPESVIVDVRTDSEGFVWLASPAGLSRYDGHSWVPLKDPALAGSVANLFVDSTGILWASFRDLGIAHKDATGWHLENRETGLPSTRYRRLSETVSADGSHELWALSADGFLLRHRPSGWVIEPGPDPQSAGGLAAIAQTHSIGGRERLWLATGDNGLWYREDGHWKKHEGDGFAPRQIEDLLVTGSGDDEALWVSTFGVGLWRLDARGARSWTHASGDLPSDELYDMANSVLPDGERVIWIASRAGLLRVHNDRVQTFDRRLGLPSNVIRGLSVWRSPDGIDVLWLATEGGVARTIAGASDWHTASLMGSSSNGVFGVRVEQDDQGGERLWIASTADGVGLYERGRWRTFNATNSAMPTSDSRMIKPATDDHGVPTLWLGLMYGHLMRIRDGPVFEAVETPWPHEIGEAPLDVLGRTVDGQHEFWVATRQSGVFRERGGQWTSMRPPGVLGTWRALSLVEQLDHAGHSWLWSSTNRGLARFDGENAVLLEREIGLPSVDLLSLTLLSDSQGRQILWVGSLADGIQRVDVTDPMHPVTLPADDLPAPPDRTAYGAMRDSTGRIYVCTNNGVQVLTKSPGGYASRVYTRKDGVVHDECNTDAQFIDVHDRFWTGMLGGVAVFDPGSEVDDRHPKPLKLIAAQVDGTDIDVTHIRVPSDSHELRLDYALLSWKRESDSRFRTTLVGYDPAPGPWTAHGSRTFSNLAPGNYRLIIEARDYAGNVSGPLEMPIDVLPAWWQTKVTRLLFASLFVFLAYAFVALRTRNLRLQRRTLEQRIEQRTAELNEANAQLRRLSYQDSLTGLANRRHLLEVLQSVSGKRPDAGVASLIFIDVDHFKAYNDQFGHPAGDMALHAVADAMRRCAPPETIVARYGGEEFACLMPGTEVAEAMKVAERMRGAIEASDIEVPGSTLVNHITISAGVASVILATPGDTHLLMRDADKALYRAKIGGRNRVRM